MVRQPTIVIFAIIVGLFACEGKQNKLSSTSIREIARDIAKSNILMGDAVGIAGNRPRQWGRYEVLRLTATDKELLGLTNDTNGVVRCYAFQALSERNTTKLFPIILQHLSDTGTVQTLYGCLVGFQKVGDFFLETITETENGNSLYQLTDIQKALVDSLLLFESDSKLKARDNLLLKIEPLEKYYQRIRQIALVEDNKIALVALSKYKRQTDKPLIAELLKDVGNQSYGFAAVVNFPDPTFFPALRETLQKEIKSNNGNNDKRLQLLYQAIVQYKDQPSRQLLQSALHEAKGMQSIYNYDYLYQALKLYPAPIYNGLLKPIYSNISTEKRGT
jgi:hypothetical protein